jgi:dienelactone hydrolase
MFTRVNALGLALWLNVVCCAGGARSGEFDARDTCRPAPDDDESAQQLLNEIVWEPARFKVTTLLAPDEAYDELVRFPSPRPDGDANNDTVSLEWYRPTGTDDGRPRPAVLVVHESGSGMTAGRLFARSLRNRGLHAFLIHLPYYGQRRGTDGRGDMADFAVTMRQGVADVRRARDALAVLPGIDADRISLQGTSLGGFVSALAGSLDRGFHRVFIMLAGGDLWTVLQNGARDSAKLRERLAAAGFEGEALRELLWNTEPLRIAHRLDPQTTWLYSAIDDDVVPLENARQLADAIGLDAAHHPQLPGDHYSVALFFNMIIDHVAEQLDAPAR